MKKEDGHSITEEVLYRHFSGQLNNEQNVLVLTWVNESESNRKEYERLRIFHLDAKALTSLDKKEHSYDTQAAWERVKAKNNIIALPTRSNKNRWVSWAASVALLIGVSIVIYNQVTKVESLVVAAIEEPVDQQLPDGSNVTVNVGSKLTYPEKFTDQKREVELSGEAYFEVEASPEKPFIIQVDELQIMAVGTAFNVSAYLDSDTTFVSVDEGVVHMIFNGEEEVLTAGDRGVFVKNIHDLSASTSVEIPVHNYWRTKRLDFYGNSLHQVIRSVEDIYQVRVELANEAIGHCKITVSFENENIEDVLDVIAATLNLEVTQENGAFVLTGEGCAD